jgi:uncharacterized membrane protein
MIAILNLTVPPVLLLLLPAAILGNYTLPAPPAFDVAVVAPDGSPLPAWVINDMLYVLQGGGPALAVYVPRYSNASGVYGVNITCCDVVVQAPPGVMIHSISPVPDPRGAVVNKSGMYLRVRGPAAVLYAPFSVSVQQPAPPPAPPPPGPPRQPAQQTPANVAAVGVTAGAGPPAEGALPWWLILAIVAAAAAALGAALAARRRRGGGGCPGLGEVDTRIIRALERRGGSALRVELERELGVAKTTLHRHLHKLARYGYVRLVQEGGLQRVELLRGC